LERKGTPRPSRKREGPWGTFYRRWGEKGVPAFSLGVGKKDALRKKPKSLVASPQGDKGGFSLSYTEKRMSFQREKNTPVCPLQEKKRPGGYFSEGRGREDRKGGKKRAF